MNIYGAAGPGAPRGGELSDGPEGNGAISSGGSRAERPVVRGDAGSGYPEGPWEGDPPCPAPSPPALPPVGC